MTKTPAEPPGAYSSHRTRNPVPHRGDRPMGVQPSTVRSAYPAAAPVGRPMAWSPQAIPPQPPPAVAPTRGFSARVAPMVFVGFSGEARSAVRDFVDRLLRSGVTAYVEEWEPPAGAKLSSRAQKALGASDGLIFFDFDQKFRVDRFEALVKGQRHQPQAPTLAFHPRAPGDPPPVLVDFRRAFDPAYLARITRTSQEDAHRMGSITHSRMDLQRSVSGPQLVNSEFVDRMARDFAYASFERTRHGH